MKDGDCTEVAVVPLRQIWRSQIVSTGTWALADAERGSDVDISDVGRRPTFYPHFVPTPDLPTLSIVVSLILRPNLPNDLTLPYKPPPPPDHHRPRRTTFFDIITCGALL